MDNNISEKFKNNLVYNDDILKVRRKKSKTHNEISVSNKLLDENIADGWEIIRKNTNTTRIKKKKPHDKYFEDRVWTLFSKLEFNVLNANSELKLPYNKDEKIPGKQIDVFAADKETVLAIECKSARTLVKKSLLTVINEIITVREGAMNFLKTFFDSRELKVKFIIATNEIILNDNDKLRMSDNEIIHLNQDDIFYFEQLTNHLGAATKYQLLGRIFKTQTILGLKNRVPAIRGKMGIYHYYSFLIEPETLLKISYILHRTSSNDSDDTTYQRMVSKSRLKEIRNFLNNEGYFPNSVIININSKRDLKFEKSDGEHDSNIAQHGILYLPQQYQSAFVIDGQHRLYGYANTKWKHKNSIPVIAFENLPTEEQVEMFVDINYKQKSVAKNLLTTIMSDLKWNSPIISDGIFALQSRLIQHLGENDDSPLYRRIVIGENKKTDLTCITLDYIIRSGFKKSKLFAKYSGNKVRNTGYFWVSNKEGSVNYQDMLEKSKIYFKNVFNYISENTKEQWDLGSKGLIAMNVGITGVIRTCDSILFHLEKNLLPGDVQTESAEKLSGLTIKFLEPLVKHINFLDTLKQKEYRSNSNAAGFENVVREFQKAIYEKINEFNPEGLQKWIEDNSGKWNYSSRVLVDEVQCAIRDHVYETLKKEFGNRWWEDGVHKEIQKKAALEKIEQGNREPEQHFVYLLDYYKIIYFKWKLFGEIYSDPDKTVYEDTKLGTRKERAINWFKELNEIRKKVSHPERAKVTEDEFRFLSDLKNWLLPKIKNVIEEHNII